MDRYQRADEVGPATPAAGEHEIKVQSQTRIRSCAAYAKNLLEGNETNKIVLKALGGAISRAVLIAESIKKTTAGLHQMTSIGTTDVGESRKPLGKDLLRSKTARYISQMTITLSKKELDTSSPGYQSPISDDQMKPSRELDNEGEVDLLPSVHAGHDGHGVHDGRWRCEGNMNGVLDDNANRGRDARHGYTWRARGIVRNLALQGRGRAYNAEISDRYGRDNMQQESRSCWEFYKQKEPQTQGPVEQHQHLDNIGTPVGSQKVAPTIDSLGDDDISRIGSACGFIFSDSGVALVRQLERQRAKLGLT